MTPARFPTASFLLLAVGAGCHVTNGPPEAPLPPCVPGFTAGQTLTLRLGPVYDAASDYIYEDSFLRSALSPSCNGSDGLGPGSTVAFPLTQELTASEIVGYPSYCSPLASFTPPSVENVPDLTTDYLESLEGVTIAAAFGEGSLDGGAANVVLGLFTPSGDPNGTLTARELPPLVVARSLEGARDACGDAWVATWEVTP